MVELVVVVEIIDGRSDNFVYLIFSDSCFCIDTMVVHIPCFVPSCFHAFFVVCSVFGGNWTVCINKVSDYFNGSYKGIECTRFYDCSNVLIIDTVNDQILDSQLSICVPSEFFFERCRKEWTKQQYKEAYCIGFQFQWWQCLLLAHFLVDHFRQHVCCGDCYYLW